MRTDLGHGDHDGHDDDSDDEDPKVPLLSLIPFRIKNFDLIYMD